ncbi:thiamine phosphate synthase [Granulosicoccus antarcticus]|uniref:Thiamine-phosphate synthase n=1 Tax=Granulosicoccus antarcticus IMCC3135 TaxID=1192854 RepID=A0A2Z2NS23_9GAMM|nr:thiamine phosphate synthase [Granulosicoccus antarcticus]ASJ74059.1 Thiamine-phosphate synthase [Granulosicoccus antarcticus IMCC3135]
MLHPFYLIVGETDHLEEFLAAGVRCVQLRIKDGSVEHCRREIRRARQLCESAGCSLIINDYWQLAIDEGCQAIHLGQEDLQAAQMETIKAAGIKFGISTHDRAELNIALSHSPDYIALGPVYATLLKKMPWRPQGLPKLQRWKDSIGDIPLVAIGGFTPERAAGAFEHGADSVCVVTDIATHADPLARITQWLAVTQKGA